MKKRVTRTSVGEKYVTVGVCCLDKIYTEELVVARRKRYELRRNTIEIKHMRERIVLPLGGPQIFLLLVKPGLKMF